jgi:hypothetical protein
MAEDAMNPPVRLIVEPPSSGPRDRLSALLRPILAIPHLLLVGGPALGILGGGYRFGALGALAFLVAVFDWFAILFGGGPISGLQPWKRLYLVWRARALAYAAFLRDEYPPFGEGDYPVSLELPPEPVTRDRTAVALRPLFVLPHLLVLMFLVMAWVVVAFVSWLWLVVNGTMPASLWRFTRDVLGYSLRIEAYALLIHDEFPAFALTDAASPGEMSGESARV